VSVGVGLELLLDYSDHERRKWRDWVAADPTRLDIAVQPGARFPTAGALLDHVFFVERRHLSRLEGAALPEQTGIPPGDWKRLFEYGDLVRADLRRYVSDIDDRTGSETMTFVPMGGGTVTMTRRRLLMHVVLHEVRHLAQLALAARGAGVPPPGEHDLFYFTEFD
jgi:uncharacterized damage-inducible protein DinB